MLPGGKSYDIMPASEAEEMTTDLSDPFDVLKLLSDKLGKEGNVKDAANVSFFKSVMTNSDKLVSQCMFVNVLEATKDRYVILKILNEGGWKTLYGWLQDAKSALNKPFLLELLKLYQNLPVTVDLLKQNSCAKDIKHLIKCNDEKISELARVVVDKWMLQVKEKTGDSNKKSEKASTDASNSDVIKSAKDGKISNKSLNSGSNHSHQSSHKSRTSEDKHLSNNTVLSIGNSSSLDNSNQDSSSSSCASVTKETVKRPKTVKMVGSNFRSTGLEVESPLPHSKKKSANSQSSSLPVSSVKKPPSSSNAEKKTTVTIPSTSTSSSSITSASATSPTEVKPKIKLIPPRAKPPEIFESSGFMDAIGSTEIHPVRRKRKLSQNNPPSQKPTTSTTTGPVTSSASPSISEEKKPVVPSFYRETMEMNPEETSQLTGNNTERENLSPVTNEQASAVDENDVEMVETNETEKNLEDDDDSAIKIGLNSTSDDTSEPPQKKKKKAVTWPDDTKLCSFFYFQLDENERVNVNKINFEETRKHELEMERQMFQNVKRMAHDTMAAKTQWRKPPLITGTNPLIIPGCNSTERKVQIEREQNVLQVLYFNKSMIPDSSAEADVEYVELVEPKEIPLTDESGTGGEVCFDHFPAATTVVSNPDVVPLLGAFNNMPSGELQQNPGLQQQPQQQQMMPQMRPGPVPPFMQPMYNMPPNMPPQMPQQMHPNMNMPMMDGRPNQNGMGFDMPGPNQGNNLPPGPMMPMMPPRPGMVQGPGVRGFPPMRPDLRPDFMMGPNPQNHPALRGGGDIEMNRMQGMMGRNERMMNPQDMPPRMMQQRDSTSRGTRTVCSHFANGYCRFGNSCRFLHQRGNGSPH